MAWSWSHTGEAYAFAYERLSELPTDELAVIFAEWRAAEIGGGIVDANEFSQRRYERALKFATTGPNDTMPGEWVADWIWNKAEEHCTCDNGGFNAWVCPYGCHTVPFGPDDE